MALRRDRNRGRTTRSIGQSLVEFALILPLAVSILGAVTDFARLYQGWITLQGATRSAAEIAATQARTSTEAASLSSAAVCGEMSGVAGFTGTASSCDNPAVSISSFTRTSSAAGATTKHPVTSVAVTTRFDFRTLFPYPLLTQDGAWTVRSEATYSVVQGR